MYACKHRCVYTHTYILLKSQYTSDQCKFYSQTHTHFIFFSSYFPLVHNDSVHSTTTTAQRCESNSGSSDVAGVS